MKKLREQLKIPPMTLLESLSTDYWIVNTQRIYDEDFHISCPVIEAYEAGFKAARELCAKEFGHLDWGNYYDDMLAMGDKEV